MSTDLRTASRSTVERYSAALVDISHRIHAEPELAFAEHRSVATLTDFLGGAGFQIEPGVGGLDTAFTATYGSGELVVGLCAEYDALPGIGHACGHNVIAAASTGAAVALRDIADRLGITVKLIGTPAEEVGGGKVLLLERGVFDDVALAMMVHPAPDETCAASSLAIADYRVHYRGRPSHAASAPHLGVNAADAITVAQVAIGLARQHLEPDQMVSGIVTNGGAAPNIVPDSTTAQFDLRAATTESLQRLEHRIRDCFHAGALATGCTHEVVPVSPVYAELSPDSWLADTYRQVITELGRSPLSPEEERQRKTGSTDMGNVTRALPAIHPTIAIDCGDAVNHQTEFATACASASADRAVLDGALALAWTTIAAATDDGQRARLLAGVAGRAAGQGGAA
ncbi:M20 family metallopeptidase [Goodfellowiella coeruleoviolacea]|uniref:Peptidase M20 domain-containing protein 2 n=1 Tax=Goodfellowiella coeruleoviolacea TaxID=334858 RepID=A0AAE3KFZ2_9PSEU|nr:M20 family metallopeptidase [Goodfellowiella coeruleoviolacea]MCP2165442.1 amidohydrolase [Goodfellowiella coeruleoviolacea]